MIIIKLRRVRSPFPKRYKARRGTFLAYFRTSFVLDNILPIFFRTCNSCAVKVLKAFPCNSVLVALVLGPPCLPSNMLSLPITSGHSIGTMKGSKTVTYQAQRSSRPVAVRCGQSVEDNRSRKVGRQPTILAVSALTCMCTLHLILCNFISFLLCSLCRIWSAVIIWIL